MAISDKPLSVVVKGQYQSSIERIFRAFTEPQLLERWLFPRDGVVMKVQALDLKVGGEFRLCFSEDGSDADVVVGRYREIVPFEKLMMTWTWEDPDPHAGIETLVTVDFRDVNGETEVTITHERFPEQTIRDRHDEGWAGALRNMERIFNSNF